MTTLNLIKTHKHYILSKNRFDFVIFLPETLLNKLINVLKYFFFQTIPKKTIEKTSLEYNTLILFVNYIY